MYFDFTVETEKFEHRIVGANFINPCCFDEDFIGWLRKEIATRLPSTFRLSEPIQEDYGWGILSRTERDTFWLCVTCTDLEKVPAQWRVIGNFDSGLNPFRYLFHKPSQKNLAAIAFAIEQALQSDGAFRIITRDGL
jgi:hypothetical protein